MEKRMAIDRICQWDERSMSALYDNFYKALVGYSLQTTGSQDASEDIVQELFAMLWERKPVFGSLAMLKAYLYNSVRNRSLNHQRHQRVENVYAADMANSPEEFRLGCEGEESFFTEEIYRQIFQQIDLLPARQREVFLLSMDGKKNREIAAQLGISAETVKTQKRRAIDTLRGKLSPEGFAIALILLG